MPDQNSKVESKIVTNKTTTSTHTKPKAPPPPPMKRSSQNGVSTKHQSEIIPERPPATPTPDYDTSSLVKVTSKIKISKSKSDAVDMESLESFKLNNPSSPTPRPPSTYFMKQQNGTLTMKKSNPSVSVTIGEYPTNTFRKQPARLGFLNGDATDGIYRDTEPVGSRLQSELVQTLSRSNLKKKTDPESIIIRSEQQIKTFESPFESILPSNGEPNENFHKRYGHTILPQPPPISIPKLPIGKSLSHNTLLGGFNDANRVKTTVQMSNGKEELTKTESLPHNGILKHSNPMFIHDRNTATQHKSIKFGQITTVIGDPEVPVMVNH